ncbi:MAG: AAA family ATPase, partial [Hyphomicrobiales bacterium]|nr:AAA family ATPase [Hyphomicrobiales bacterium]
LTTLVENGGFRLDLYYRISPIVIELPPLRDRLEDISALAEKFLRDIAYRHARPVPEFGPDAIAQLVDRAWPGNVRQLQHEVERAFAFCDGDTITTSDLSDVPRRVSAVVPPIAAEEQPARELKDIVADVQSEEIREALAACNGNKKKAAELLGISRSFLYKKLAEMDRTD